MTAKLASLQLLNFSVQGDYKNASDIRNSTETPNIRFTGHLLWNPSMVGGFHHKWPVMQKSVSIMIVFLESLVAKIHLYSPYATSFTIIGNLKAVALLTGRIVLDSTTMAAVITNLDMTTHTQLCFELLTMSHLKGLTVKVKNVMYSL